MKWADVKRIAAMLHSVYCACTNDAADLDEWYPLAVKYIWAYQQHGVRV